MIKIQNFSDICRICLKFVKQSTPISKSNVISMLSKCSSVEVWLNDGLPNQLCKNCLNKLRQLYKFKLTIEQSDKTLRSLLKDAEDVSVKSEEMLESPTSTDNEYDCTPEEIEENKPVERGTIVNSNNFSIKNEKKPKKKIGEEVVTNVKENEENKPVGGKSTININNFPIKNEKELKKEVGDVFTNVKETNEIGVKIESFKSEQEANDNFVTDSNEKTLEFDCPKCDFKCEYVENLDTHLKEIHNESAMACPTCNKLFYTQLHLTIHQNVHVPRNKKKKEPLTCNVCNHVFPLRRKIGPFPCIQCNVVCKSHYVLDRHVKRVHMNIRPPPNKEPCNVCGKLVINLKRHVKTHFSDDTREVFTCPECSKKFLIKYNLDIHMRAVHLENSKKFLCPGCGKSFPSNGKLNMHLTCHETEFCWSCDMCDRKFRRKKAMVLHKRSKHLNIRNFPCDVCDARFSNGDILRKHIMIHTGEKPYKCKECERPFRQPCALRTHLRLMHGIGERKKRNTVAEKESEKKVEKNKTDIK